MTGIMQNGTVNVKRSGHLEDFPDVLTVEDLMDFLHIGRSVAYRMVRGGEIESIRIGTLYRIPKHCVEEWMKGEGVKIA